MWTTINFVFHCLLLVKIAEEVVKSTWIHISLLFLCHRVKLSVTRLLKTADGSLISNDLFNRKALLNLSVK